VPLLTKDMIPGITLGNVNYKLEMSSTSDIVYPDTYLAGRGSFGLIDLCLLARSPRIDDFLCILQGLRAKQPQHPAG
jgi:hypothetical protein